MIAAELMVDELLRLMCLPLCLHGRTCGHAKKWHLCVSPRGLIDCPVVEYDVDARWDNMVMPLIKYACGQSG